MAMGIILDFSVAVSSSESRLKSHIKTTLTGAACALSFDVYWYIPVVINI
jgi:hypothetical protein